MSNLQAPLSKFKWDKKKLSKEMELELIERYQKTKDEEAIEILLQNHIALVKHIVAKAKPPQAYFDDALIEGILGFVIAVEKFDPIFDTRLTTYATTWIRLYVQRFLETSINTIYIPINKSQSLKKAIKESNERDEPLSEEFLDLLKNQEVLSLDYTINYKDDQDKTLLDVLADTLPSPEDYVNEQLLREDVENVFDALSPKEAYVIRSYFGIDGTPQRNFVDIADDLNVSHQRIQQIFTKAINKLREPPLIQEFAKIATEYGIVSEKSVKELLAFYDNKQKKSLEVYWRKKDRENHTPSTSNYKKKKKLKNMMNYSAPSSKTAKGTIIPVVSKSRPLSTTRKNQKVDHTKEPTKGGKQDAKE